MLTRLLVALLALATLSLQPSAFSLNPSLVFAADHAAANETIWPSQNDVAQTAGDGKKLLENQWAKPTAVFAGNNYSLTGLTVPGTSGTLNINVALGTAYLAGRHITIPAATTVTATASTTNFVFLKLTRDGSNLVTGAAFEVNVSGTPPADSTPIATLTAGATTITATSDLRILPTTITVLTSGTSWVVPAGISRAFVEVIGASGGGGGGGSAATTTAGTAGGTGGTTSFDTYSVTGGSGGVGGLGATSGNGATPGAHGVASGAPITLNGNGSPGGGGGTGAQTSTNTGQPGAPGGFGSYAAGYISLVPGSSITIAIGAAGAAGSGGSGGAGGLDGVPGRILIYY